MTELPKYVHSWLSEYTSNTTKRLYTYAVHRLMRYLGEVEVIAATIDDIAGAWEQLRGERMSDAGHNQAVSAWRSLYAYLHDTDRIQVNPSRRLKQRPVARGPRRTPTPDHVQAIWKVLLNGDVWAHASYRDRRRILRDRAFYALIVTTGLRASECANLDVQHVLLEERTVQCRQKGGRERVAAFPEEVVTYIEPLVVGREPEAPYLASVHSRKRLHPNNLNDILADLCEVAGTPRYTIHSFRRFFVTDALHRLPLHDVSRAVGHAQLGTTLIYYEEMERAKAIGRAHLPEDE